MKVNTNVQGRFAAQRRRTALGQKAFATFVGQTTYRDALIHTHLDARSLNHYECATNLAL